MERSGLRWTWSGYGRRVLVSRGLSGRLGVGRCWEIMDASLACLGWGEANSRTALRAVTTLTPQPPLPPAGEGGPRFWCVRGYLGWSCRETFGEGEQPDLLREIHYASEGFSLSPCVFAFNS